MRSLRQLGNPDGSPAKAGLMLFAFPNGNHGDEPTRSAVSDASGVAILPLQRDKEYAISVALDRDHPNGSVTNIRLGWTESDKLPDPHVKQPGVGGVLRKQRWLPRAHWHRCRKRVRRCELHRGCLV